MAERLDGEDRVERIVRSIDVQEVAVHVLSQMSQALFFGVFSGTFDPRAVASLVHLLGQEKQMRVAIGADHAGFPLKQQLTGFLANQGHTVFDLGTHDSERVDYPDYTLAVAHAITEGRADRGIMICGTGAGASIVANKVKGIRASIAHDTYSAHQAVEHDDMNLLCLGSRVIGPALAEELVKAFLDARLIREDAYLRRLAKVKSLDNQR